jgi:mono/diheme cytochrome c family protein
MTRLATFAAIIGLACTTAHAQDAGLKPYAPEQIKQGAKIYAVNCAACHGARMANPEWAIDLRTFPRDERARFVDSVMHGRGGMPSWGDVLTADEIAALWAYMVAGDPPK